jgi:hypothetical protein
MVASRIRVHPHIQIIFPRLYLVDRIKIATLKTAIESHFVISTRLRVHACKLTLGIGVF